MRSLQVDRPLGLLDFPLQLGGLTICATAAQVDLGLKLLAEVGIYSGQAQERVITESAESFRRQLTRCRELIVVDISWNAKV
jgi:hypothetical protein